LPQIRQALEEIITFTGGYLYWISFESSGPRQCDEQQVDLVCKSITSRQYFFSIFVWLQIFLLALLFRARAFIADIADLLYPVVDFA